MDRGWGRLSSVVAAPGETVADRAGGQGVRDSTYYHQRHIVLFHLTLLQ